MAHFFWFSGEIVGDWYPLLRIKAITYDKRKMTLVYITCILYNITKILAMFCGFLSIPMDLKKKDTNSTSTKDLDKYNLAWWSTILFMQIASYFYDLSVIIALKSSLYDRLQEFKKYNKLYMILKKFKLISEYRIILSMTASLIFLPFISLFVVFLFLKYYYSNSMENINDYNFIPSDVQIEHLRVVVLNINYALMYIDQILLKFYIKKSPKPKHSYSELSLNVSVFQNDINNDHNSNDNNYDNNNNTNNDSKNNYYNNNNNINEIISKEDESKSYSLDHKNSYESLSDNNSKYYYDINKNNMKKEKVSNYEIDILPIKNSFNIYNNNNNNYNYIYNTITNEDNKEYYNYNYSPFFNISLTNTKGKKFIQDDDFIIDTTK